MLGTSEGIWSGPDIKPTAGVMDQGLSGPNEDTESRGLHTTTTTRTTRPGLERVERGRAESRRDIADHDVSLQEFYPAVP